MNTGFCAERRGLLTAAGLLAATGLLLPSIALTSERWNRAGGLAPKDSWWAGGGPREAPSVVRIVPADEPGERLTLSGQILDAEGRALAGVTVYVYQTDVLGLYNPEGRYGVPHRIRGWARTVHDGRYEFVTIMPGHYPNRTTPAHIHMTVCSDSIPEWWLPELRFEGDPLITADEYDASRRDGRFGNIRPLYRAADGALRCIRDLRI